MGILKGQFFLSANCPFKKSLHLKACHYSGVQMTPICFWLVAGTHVTN